MNQSQRRYKRRIMAQLAASLSDFVDLNEIDTGVLDDNEAHQVVVELAGEFERRAAGRWR